MKSLNVSYLIYTFISCSILAVSCMPASDKAEVEIQMDSVESVRAAIKTKTQELSSLQSEIKSLNDQLQKIDPTAKRAKVPVEVKTLENSTFESYSTFQANVMADDLGMASSETGGRLTSLIVKEGQYVNAGQLIGSVDLSQIQTQKQEVLTSLTLAQTVFERQERLWKQNIGSEIQYLQAKNNVERIEKSLQIFDKQMSKANIYAPISGVVDRVVIKQGEMSAPGSPIIMILNTSKLKVQADVPESFLSSVKVGTSVDVYFPAIDVESTKRIASVGRSIDPANRTFKIEMNTSSMGGKIKPNLLAEVTLKDKSAADVIYIPVNLLQQEVSGDNFVYIEENGLAAKRKVVTGDSNDETIIIDDGLAPGDKLIMAGAIGLSNGAELIVTEYQDPEEGE